MADSTILTALVLLLAVGLGAELADAVVPLVRDLWNQQLLDAQAQIEELLATPLPRRPDAERPLLDRLAAVLDPWQGDRHHPTHRKTIPGGTR